MENGKWRAVQSRNNNLENKFWFLRVFSSFFSIVDRHNCYRKFLHISLEWIFSIDSSKLLFFFCRAFVPFTGFFAAMEVRAARDTLLSCLLIFIYTRAQPTHTHFGISAINLYNWRWAESFQIIELNRSLGVRQWRFDERLRRDSLGAH